MTRSQVLEWLRRRVPAPPKALAERLEQVLGAYPGEGVAGAATMSALMSSLGLTTLGALAGRDPRSADVALDLLAADAFVTFAFEAAAEEGGEVGLLVSRILQEAAT